MVSLQHEKANAMLEIILLFVKLSVVLWLFSQSSWFPVTLQAFWYSYAKLMLLFNNSFYTFLLLNAIIFSLYALSNNKNGADSLDFYEEILNHSESRLKITEPVVVNNQEESTPEKEKQTETVDSSEKPVTSSKVGVSSPILDETVTAVTETTTTTTCCTTASTRSMTDNGEKVSEKKCYRRVQSESIERRVVVAPRREFKRVNTIFSRQLQGRLCYDEHLSKEELNRAVEEFIAKQRMQWEGESEKTQYFGFNQ